LIYPKHFEQKIGFDKIRSILHHHCLCDSGKKNVDAMRFSISYADICEKLAQTNEYKHILLFEDTFPESNYVDLTENLIRIRIGGTWMQTEELSDLRRSLITIFAIIIFFKHKEEDQYPQLRKRALQIEHHKIVIDTIDVILDKNGKIKDNASPELAQIRRKLNKLKSEVASVMHRLLKEAKQEGWTEADTEISVRDGRLVIPINSTHKRKFKGFIHDESSTGKTSFIEPAESFEKNNAILELEFVEHREIIRILTQFTDFLRPYRDDLIVSYEFLGFIDFVRAKGKLAIELDAVMPNVFDEQIVQYKSARHPLLFLSHKKENKNVVAQDIELTQKQRILVISGPNAGGKSVCLKMVALVQYMLQCGLLIPILSISKCGIFEQIFIDIGDEQSIENDLSTYSSHLKNMKFFVENAHEKTMVLIDEFGAGTEPLLGGAIAESILEKLNELHTFGIINTHYSNLKHFAMKTDGIVNGSMLFDSEQMHPLFKLSIGAPGSSFAFEIAQNMGIPKYILQKASEKIGHEHIDFDKTLKTIENDKQFIDKKILEIEEKEKHLNEVLHRYNTKLGEINTKKKEIIEQAHHETKQLLNNTNKIIEQTIRQIKESQAEKESTRSIRKELEDFKIQTELDTTAKEATIQKKIEQIRQREDRRINKQKEKNEVISDKHKPVGSTFEKIEPIIGDYVHIENQTAIGELIAIKGSDAVVSFGTFTTKVKLHKLIKDSKSDIKQKKVHSNQRLFSEINYNILEKRKHFVSELDVRGKRTDEALQLVTEFVEQAIVLGVTHIQILHGKGDGILRTFIHKYLKTVDMVVSFSDAHVELGGAGITVIELE